MLHMMNMEFLLYDWCFVRIASTTDSVGEFIQFNQAVLSITASAVMRSY